MSWWSRFCQADSINHHIYQLLIWFLSLNFSFNTWDILYTWESIESCYRCPFVWFLALACFPDHPGSHIYFFFIFCCYCFVFSFVPCFFFVGWAVGIGLRPSHSSTAEPHPHLYCRSCYGYVKIHCVDRYFVFSSSVDIWVVSTY